MNWVVKKRQKDIFDIDQEDHFHVCQRNDYPADFETIEDIYGFETSESFLFLM